MTGTPERARVLVTGAAGRLGTVVADLFHRNGFDVLATDITAAVDVPYRFRQADLLDHEAALDLLQGVDVLLHIGNHPGLGGRPPQLVFNQNVTMNENVFQGAAEQGVGRIVFASTLQLIGSHVDDRTVVDAPSAPTYPLHGDTPPTPSNLYALSKTVTEVMLRYYAERCGIDCTAIRFPLLHNDPGRVLVASGQESPTDLLEAFAGLTYDDAAELFLAVVRSELTGYRVFMAGTSHRHRDLEMPDLLAKFYPQVPPDTPDLVDVEAVTAATGWRPSPYQPQPQPQSQPGSGVAEPGDAEPGDAEPGDADHRDDRGITP